MKRLALLVGSFLVTFALLISVWMVGTGRMPFAGLSATPSPVPTLAPTDPPVTTPVSTLTPSPSPTASAALSPTPSPTPNLATPSPSPAPLRTVAPSLGLPPSSQPGNTQTFTMLGKEYTSYQLPEGGSLLLNGDSLVLHTTEDSPDALWVTYTLDPALLPQGATIHSVSVDVCGRGSGFFWESYGPPGSEPLEYEIVPPDADGCWHFRDARTSDLSAIVATMLESTMVIDQVVFKVTFAG
jgi:hypothetical protein